MDPSDPTPAADPTSLSETPSPGGFSSERAPAEEMSTEWTDGVVSVAEPTEPTEPTEPGEPGPPLRRRRSGMGVAAKLTSGVLFAALLAVAGVLAMAFLSVRDLALDHHRALAAAVAQGLASSAEDLLVAGDGAALQARVAEAAARSELAYAIVLDGDDRAVAHNFTPNVPSELLTGTGGSGSRQRTYRDPEAGVDRRVIEVEVPITAGQSGRVKVGVDLDDLDLAAAHELKRAGIAAAAGLVLAWLIGLALGRRTAKPIRGLVDAVDRITRDDLDSMTAVGSRDEIGLLSETVNDAILHLRQRRPEPSHSLGFDGGGFDGGGFDGGGFDGGGFDGGSFDDGSFDPLATSDRFGGAQDGRSTAELGLDRPPEPSFEPPPVSAPSPFQPSSDAPSPYEVPTLGSASAEAPSSELAPPSELAPSPALSVPPASSSPPPPPPPPSPTSGDEPRADLRVEIAELLGLARSLSEGNLGSRGRVTADAVGVAVESLNRLAEGLVETFGALRSQAASITSDAAQTLADGEAAADLAGDQVRTVGQATERLGTVEAAVARLSEGCRHVGSSVSEARGRIGPSRESAQASVARLDRLRQGVDGLGDRVKRVGEGAMELMEAVDLLSQVATQTHLLSLNAAIEASSAGENGVRFGVVAGEMRQLSAEVGGVSKQLGERVRHLRDEVQVAVAAVEDGTEGLNASVESVEQLSGSLADLEGLVERTVGLGDELARTAPEVDGELGALRLALEALEQGAVQLGTAWTDGRDRAEAIRQAGTLQARTLDRYQAASDLAAGSASDPAAGSASDLAAGPTPESGAE